MSLTVGFIVATRAGVSPDPKGAPIFELETLIHWTDPRWIAWLGMNNLAIPAKPGLLCIRTLIKKRDPNLWGLYAAETAERQHRSLKLLMREAAGALRLNMEIRHRWGGVCDPQRLTDLETRVAIAEGVKAGTDLVYGREPWLDVAEGDPASKMAPAPASLQAVHDILAADPSIMEEANLMRRRRKKAALN